MTDQEQPFGGAFVPQPPDKSHTATDPQAQPASRRKRGARRSARPAGARQAVAKTLSRAQAKPVAASAVPSRRGRQPTSARATRIDVSVAVTAFAGLTEEAATALATLTRVIDALPKRMRFPVVRALGKLFP